MRCSWLGRLAWKCRSRRILVLRLAGILSLAGAGVANAQSGALPECRTCGSSAALSSAQLDILYFIATVELAQKRAGMPAGQTVCIGLRGLAREDDLRSSELRRIGEDKAIVPPGIPADLLAWLNRGERPYLPIAECVPAWQGAFHVRPSQESAAAMILIIEWPKRLSGSQHVETAASVIGPGSPSYDDYYFEFSVPTLLANESRAVVIE